MHMSYLTYHTCVNPVHALPAEDSSLKCGVEGSSLSLPFRRGAPFFDNGECELVSNSAIIPSCRRLQVKKDLGLSRAAGAAAEEAGADEPEKEESELDEEEKILGEMDEVKAAAAARAKKERKKRREAKTKARVRAAQLALSESSTLSLPVSGQYLLCPSKLSYVSVDTVVCLLDLLA